MLSAFEVIEPRRESPVVVEVPHAGLYLDPESLAWTVAPARSIGRDADLHVDALFADAPEAGATLLVARTSRLVVDLNRSESDVDCEAVEGGGMQHWPRGLIWRLTTDGDAVLSRRLPREELERRLSGIYRPYHARLAELLARKRARFGVAVLLCAHSMPSVARSGHAGAIPARADIVPGTRGRTSAAGLLIDEVDRHCRERGLSVRHDDPYRGGFSTAHYGRPDQRVHAVQIEIARRLYMDEQSLGLDTQGFDAMREFGRTLVTRLASPEFLERLRQLDVTA
ncbi:N-formylglutamate amidohydrolase [Chondromyces crocatus]|uniref:N-formylglutamate amidohydrolase n=1 Tax=Chondromyces crocatus TaxID=52 RepID=UPI001FDFFE3C|nr:N-formylglutamate amidohydrolase [Chondromyces crocatus]